MAAAIEGTPLRIDTDGASYTAESGSDRLVVVLLVGETLNAGRTCAPDFGGELFTEGVFIEGAEANFPLAYIGFIKEADIPGGSNAVNFNWSGALSNDDGIIFTVSGADQADPGTGFSKDAEKTGVGDLAITGVTDGVAVAGIQQTSGNVGNDAAWDTHVDNVGGTSYAFSAESKTTTAGGDTYSPGLQTNPAVLVSFVVNPAGGGGGGITASTDTRSYPRGRGRGIKRGVA